MKIDWQRNWYFISQILSILGFVFFGLLVSQLLGLSVGKYIFHFEFERATEIISNPGMDTAQVNFLRLFQVITSVGTFALPVFIYTWAYKYPPLSTLKLKQPLSFMQVIMVMIFSVAVLFGVGFFSEINHLIPVPENMAQGVKNAEEMQDKLLDAMLYMPNIKHLLFCLFAMGLVPAFSEELMFRGILQPLFKNWTKNIHQGILISAALFSLVHFDYHDFISRFAIAIGFGYLFYWSGSLWITILAHFLNNSIEVLIHYFKDTNSWCNYLIKVNYLPLYMELTGVAVVLLVMWWFKQRADNKLIEPPQN